MPNDELLLCFGSPLISFLLLQRAAPDDIWVTKFPWKNLSEDLLGYSMRLYVWLSVLDHRKNYI